MDRTAQAHGGPSEEPSRVSPKTVPLETRTWGIYPLTPTSIPWGWPPRVLLFLLQVQVKVRRLLGEILQVETERKQSFVLKVSWWAYIGTVPTAALKADETQGYGHKHCPSKSRLYSRMWDLRAEDTHEALCLIVFRLTHLIRDKSQILRINFSLERKRKERVPALCLTEGCCWDQKG